MPPVPPVRVPVRANFPVLSHVINLNHLNKHPATLEKINNTHLHKNNKNNNNNNNKSQPASCIPPPTAFPLSHHLSHQHLHQLRVLNKLDVDSLTSCRLHRDIDPSLKVYPVIVRAHNRSLTNTT